MSVKLKALANKSIIRPALTYGSETWTLTKRHVHTIQVAEMKMLRSMCGITMLDQNCNEYIRGSLDVRDIAKRSK